MKPSTRLDSVVFQLTPTRTRCDLLITANGNTEKITTGLLDPFLAHLKTARDQVAKGGYSIVLKPKDSDSAAAWFTKATIQRFVRFVSNPDVLERVYTLETEIMQIREAIGIQNNYDVTSTVVVEDNLRAKRAESTQGSRALLQDNEEKAIVLYEPDSHPKQANLSTTSDENSKVQVLKVLETRKKVLQKEQGMAFARAVAAGFQVDDMMPLISFAKSFGASRLMDACLKFMDSWKKKHESGQRVEIDATQPNAANMRRNSWPGTTVNNDVKSPTDNKANVNQEHVPMYAPWPVHSPPGTFPVFQGYTMQGMPCYPNYPYPSPYPSTDDSRRSSGQRKAKKHHSSCSSEDSGSEDQDKEKGKSGRRRKLGKVVIRNLNYINSKKQDHSRGTESNAEEEEGVIVVECCNGKERETKGTEGDTGDWKAFQTLLLQDADREVERTVDHLMEKDRQVTGRYDPLAYDEREAERYRERDTADIRNGAVTRRVRASSDSFMVHQRENGFENPSDPLNLNGFDNGLEQRSSVNMYDDSYIATREAGSSNRNAIDMGSEISSYHQADGNERKKINYEPHDLSLMPERETEKLSAGYDPALDFGSKALKKNEAGVTKKSVRDPTSRLSKDAADKRKASSGVIRKGGRPTKMSPSDEARARADKLRSFKADLLIMKKEKEEEERKRIEGLKIARQKRIAAKSNSTVGQSQLSAQQARKHLPNRFSPGAPRASKFSDTEPGSLSPLQRRLPIRSASLGSNEPQKVPKNNSKPSSGSKSTGNRLTRSVSPLPPSKRESIVTGNRLTRSTSPLHPSKRETRISLDSQNESVSRARRVSEPKTGNAPSSVVRALYTTGSRLTRSISPLPLSKRETRASLDSQNKSVSRTRRLSEPKMGSNSAPSSAVRSLRTVASRKASDAAPEIKKLSAIVNYDIAKIASLPELKIKPPKGPNNALAKRVEKIKSSASEIEPSGGNKNNAVDETPVVEKTVVMVLPSSARSISADQTIADKKAIGTMQESGNDLVLVRPETLSDLITETPKFLTIQSVVEKPYEALDARVSSLEVPGTVYSECSQEPGPSFHSNETAQETAKVVTPEKKISEALKRSQTRESATKGLRKLLKFGKKSRSSSTSSNKDHEPAVTSATTSEALTLKNLISQDETPTAATASHKSSRHFSLLSPFKSKKREYHEDRDQSPFTVFKSCRD